MKNAKTRDEPEQSVTIKAPNIKALAVTLRGTAPYVQLRFSEKAQNAIREKMSQGTTANSKKTRCTAISPATFARWEKSGHSLFKVAADGNLMMAAGKSYGRITTGEMLLVRISAQ